MKISLTVLAGFALMLLSAILFTTLSVDRNDYSEQPAADSAQPLKRNGGNESEAKLSLPTESSAEQTSSRVTNVETAKEEESEASVDEKTELLLKIDEAVSLYSEEGVDQIAPLLLSPDIEIRESAIEGMKQLGLPKAAVALREAASKSTTRPEDRAAMLEAAEFTELPEYQIKK